MITEHTMKIAKVCHAAERAVHVEQGDEKFPEWDGLTDEQRDMALIGVDFLLANPYLGAAALQANWIKAMEVRQWSYGPRFDTDLRTHPNMLPFGQLTQGQQMIGHLRRSIVKVMGNV